MDRAVGPALQPVLSVAAISAELRNDLVQSALQTEDPSKRDHAIKLLTLLANENQTRDIVIETRGVVNNLVNSLHQAFAEIEQLKQLSQNQSEVTETLLVPRLFNN